jgi:tetratricopeptide (TPR) repeat protein
VLFQKTLAIYRSSLEADRLPTIYIVQRLAEIARTRGDFVSAEELAREAVALAHKLGSNESLLAVLLPYLAVALQLQGKYQEAEDAFLEVLEIYERTLGDEATEIIEARANLAAVLIDAGDLDDAAPLVQKLEQDRATEAARSQSWLPHHLDSVRGAYLGRTGELTQAETLLLQAHAALREQRGAQDRYVLMAEHRLASFYEHIGKPEKAREHRVPSPSTGDITP